MKKSLKEAYLAVCESEGLEPDANVYKRIAESLIVEHEVISAEEALRTLLDKLRGGFIGQILYTCQIKLKALCDEADVAFKGDDEPEEEKEYLKNHHILDEADDSGTKYPSIKVKLVGNDGNAFAVMGRVREALKSGLRKLGKTSQEIANEVALYTKEATSGDYDNLLATSVRWVSVS